MDDQRYEWPTYRPDGTNSQSFPIDQWLKQAGNPVRLGTWILAISAVVIVWLLSSHGGLMEDLLPETIGIAFTVVFLEELTLYRSHLQREEELLEQLNSPVRDFAVEALRLIRKDEKLFSELDKSKLEGVKWAGADLIKADLSGALLNEANLNGAYLLSTDLSGAYLSGANLHQADLSGALLNGALLSFANLRCSDLRKADLRGAYLLTTDLRKARYHSSTQWPKDFDPAAAGAILVEDDAP